MKKLVALLALVGGVGFVARNSALFSVWQLKAGLDAGNVAQVERYADLQALATVPVDVAVLAAQGSAQDAGGGALGSIAGAIGELLGGVVKNAAGTVAVNELKARIEKRDVASLLGGFVPNGMPLWFGGTQDVAEGTVVTIKGTCDSRATKGTRVDVEVGVKFVRVPGPMLGYPADYKAAGIETSSLRTFVKTCAF